MIKGDKGVPSLLPARNRNAVHGGVTAPSEQGKTGAEGGAESKKGPGVAADLAPEHPS